MKGKEKREEIETFYVKIMDREATASGFFKIFLIFREGKQF